MTDCMRFRRLSQRGGRRPRAMHQRCTFRLHGRAQLVVTHDCMR